MRLDTLVDPVPPTQLEALRARKAELEELIKLQAEISTLEARMLLGDNALAGSIRTVAEIVCAHYKLPVSQITSRRRDEFIVLPRHVIFYVSHQICGANYSTLGRVFERDHNTIKHGTNSVRDRRDTNPAFARELEHLVSTTRTSLGLPPRP